MNSHPVSTPEKKCIGGPEKKCITAGWEGAAADARHSFKQRHAELSFPVRSMSLLSRPDLASPWPRCAQGRRWEEQSHAQHREHGEHRTFRAVSTVAGLTASQHAALGAVVRVNAHRALGRKSGTRPAKAPAERSSSGYQPAAENNEATAPQIAAQIPSDRSTVTIKYARASGR